MTHVVVGVFDDMGKVPKVRQELKSAGFSDSEITVKSRDGTATPTRSTEGSDEKEEGGIAHFFRSLFGLDSDNEHSGMYSEAVRRNNAVVTVNAGDESKADRAEAILERCGAIDVDERSEQWRQEGWTPPSTMASGATPSASSGRSENAFMPRPTGQRMAGGNETLGNATRGQSSAGANEPMANSMPSDTRKIPVVEEELEVGKREVRRGGVRVFSRVRETPVEESVQLRQEKAKVTRKPVDRPASEADLAAFKETSIEVRETAEEPVVAKRARVVEEVEVGKETTQRQETVRDTVRRTDVEVEQLGGASADHDADFREHWTSNYGTSGSKYDEYAPAYRYGSTLAGSGEHTGRTWDEIEPEAREDWEKRYPGSAWERFKDSVRYGWEKLTGSHSAGARASTSTTSQPRRTSP